MLTPDDLAALPGPSWLHDRRRAALAALADAPPPTSAEEVWRYSRIDELDLGRFTPSTAPPPASALASATPSGLAAALAGAAVTATVRDGWLVDVAGDSPASVGVATDAAQVGVAYSRAHDAFGHLHAAGVATPVVVSIPAGAVIEQPIVVVHHLDTDGVAAFPHTVVDAGADSEATVVEVRVAADGAALVVPVTELRLGAAARLRYLDVQDWGPRVWQLGQQAAVLDADARLLTACVALGGDYARLRLDVRLAGKGAEADLVAVYFGEGTQMHDFRTLQDHRAPRTRSNLLFKGAVEDKARSVYSGLIKVRPEAVGTSAFQTNRNIKLSPDAWAESVPNLEIETNDVQCSHASAVGPIDEDQLFYLESRGVPAAVAERLVVLGFFDEVVHRLPVPALRPSLRDAIDAKLARRRG